jgi:methyl-accepting chemotaxis protein
MLYQLNHLRIRTKILVCAAAIVVLVVILASVVYIDIAESEAREERVVRAADIVQSSDALRNDLTTMELSFRSYLLTGDENFANSYEQRAQTEQQEQLRLGQLVGDDASQVDQLDLLDVAVRDWRSAVQQPTIESHRAGEFTSGTALFTATATRDAQDFAQIEQQLTSIRTIEQQRSDAERQNAQDANDALRLALLIGTLLTAVLSVGTLWLLSTNIARRVQRVTTAATRIARGEAGVRCELPDSRDEVGLMGTSTPWRR